MVWRDSRADSGMRTQNRIARLIGPEYGFNAHNLQAFINEVAPGSSEGGYHMHGEAVKYYLQGRGVETIGDGRYEVEEGDVAFIPAHTWHGTLNPGPEPVLFLAVVQRRGVALQTPITYKIREEMRDEARTAVGGAQPGGPALAAVEDY